MCFRFVLPLLILLVSTFAQAQSPYGGMMGGIMGGFIMGSGGSNPSCSDSKPFLKFQNRLITGNYKDQDVSDNIQAVKSYMKTCNISMRSVGIPDDFYNHFLKETQKSELSRIKSELELYSKTGKIDAQEKAYREYAKKIGLPERFVDQYLREQKNAAQAAFEKEKKSCTPVDLSEELGPVRDQDSIGWCYAFASADLLSYKLKKKISAADIALTYNKDFLNDLLRMFGRNEGTFHGGWPKLALEKSLSKGLCLEKDLPSEDNANAQFVDRLTDIDNIGRQKIDSGLANCNALYNQTKVIFPNVKIRDLQEVLRNSSKKDFIENMANKTCASRIQADLKVESVSNGDPADFGNFLDQQIGKKNPVSLTYDATVLTNKRDYSKIYGHASVLAGRKFNQSTGQCEYLIRNSWGRGCDSYDPSFSCKDGNIWVPKADILKRSYEATYIK